MGRAFGTVTARLPGTPTRLIWPRRPGRGGRCRRRQKDHSGLMPGAREEASGSTLVPHDAQPSSSSPRQFPPSCSPRCSASPFAPRSSGSTRPEATGSTTPRWSRTELMLEARKAPPDATRTTSGRGIRHGWNIGLYQFRRRGDTEGDRYSGGSQLGGDGSRSVRPPVSRLGGSSERGPRRARRECRSGIRREGASTRPNRLVGRRRRPAPLLSASGSTFDRSARRRGGPHSCRTVHLCRARLPR